MNLKQKFSFKTLLFMIESVFRATPVLFSLLILIKIIETSIGLVALYVLKDATNLVAELVINKEILTKALIMTFIYLILLLVINSLVEFMREIIDGYYYKNADRYFRILLMYKLGKLSQEKLYEKDTYDKYNFAYRNLYVFQQLPWHILNFVFDFSFKKIIYLAVIFSFNIYAGLISVGLFLFNLIYNIIYSKKRVNLDKKFNNDERKKENYVSLISQKYTIKETKVNQLENYFFKKQDDISQTITKERYKILTKEAIISRCVNIFIVAIKLFYDIFLLYLVFKKQIDLGTMVLISAAISTATQIGYNFKRPLEKIVEFVEIAPVIVELIFPLTKEEKKEINHLGEKEFSLTQGEFDNLRLENVSYHYPLCEEYVVKDVNLEIKKGDIISILGYNGSGKTTTSKLLLGLFKPTSGNIYFNNKNIKDIPFNELSMYFGVGFQEYARYQLSLKENIAFGKVEDIDNEELINEAIKKANLESIINDLPKGINTCLGKKYDKDGQDLSGGQWQRVIQARAYMKNPEILVLDEPTAAIDPIEEERILKEFRYNLQGKTAILISHRISFARLASKIIMMKDGMIVESGTHDELLKKKGYYYELFTAQQTLYQGEKYGEEI